MYVVGTAGHVDHGKSTLISALTGINPDRLKEEQERQMTIDLGFAWYTLPSGEEIGIVDVPGHRDFVENMLAGVGGIDAVLFVIAADEGIMPQSREHLDILKLLGIKLGIIVFTKIDLVKDPEWLDLVESDVRDLVKNSFLENAPIARVSAVNGDGLSELSERLDSLLKTSTPKKDLQEPRLPIDRIFSLKGFGTIVTGTLLDGSLREGDQVEILPAGIKSRIRGIQNHKKKQQVAEPGNRTAINLVGVDVDEIQRGDVVCLPDRMRPTRRIDAAVELLENKTAKIKHDDYVKVFIGTSQTLARARVIGKKEINPGENGSLQLEFEKEVLVKNKDRFIVRRPSPPETIGGGYVVGAHPKQRYKRFSENVVESFKILTIGSDQEKLLVLLDKLKFAEISTLIETSEMNRDSVIDAVENLIKASKIIPFDSEQKIDLSSWITSINVWEETKQKISNILDDYHKKNPLEVGLNYDDLAKRVGLSKKAATFVINKLVFDKVIKAENGIVSLEDHRIEFSENQKKLMDQLILIFSKTPYSTPSVQECIEIVGNEVFKVMLSSGILIEISPGIVYRKDDLDMIITKTVEFLNVNHKLLASEFRDQFKTSRKYAIALLEYMDKHGITERIDDYRTLKKS